MKPEVKHKIKIIKCNMCGGKNFTKFKILEFKHFQAGGSSDAFLIEPNLETFMRPRKRQKVYKLKTAYCCSVCGNLQIPIKK